jgi:hypothetical protein
MARTYRDTVTTPAAARSGRPGARPFVSLLSDFGSRDPSAGIMRAVIVGICRDASLVDISHEVDRFAIRDGALVLWSAVPYLPVGVHVAVVDPGVGTERLGIVVETARGDFLVGPDNGLLLPAAGRLGGIMRAHALENPLYQLAPRSTTFHGRDVFAPAAAHLAARVPPEAFGSPLDPRQLVVLDWPEADIRPGWLGAQAIYVDGFGNVKLAALADDLTEAFPGARHGERFLAGIDSVAGRRTLTLEWAEAFGRVHPGVAVLITDSYGRLTLAVNRGSAAAAFGIRPDTPVALTRAGPPPRR